MSRPRNVSRQARLLLAVLKAEPQAWRHGYELCKQTGVVPGTLYPLLMRLNAQGLLESEWRPAQPPGRLPRRVCRLTQNGLALAHEQSRSRPSLPIGDLQLA